MGGGVWWLCVLGRGRILAPLYMKLNSGSVPDSQGEIGLFLEEIGLFLEETEEYFRVASSHFLKFSSGGLGLGFCLLHLNHIGNNNCPGELVCRIIFFPHSKKSYR